MLICLIWLSDWVTEHICNRDCVFWKAMTETGMSKGTPQLGLRFKNPDEAWKFWVAYGGSTGFDVRKRYANVS